MNQNGNHAQMAQRKRRLKKSELATSSALRLAACGRNARSEKIPTPTHRNQRENQSQSKKLPDRTGAERESKKPPRRTDPGEKTELGSRIKKNSKMKQTCARLEKRPTLSTHEKGKSKDKSSDGRMNTKLREGRLK
jgi:hypothetical protein